MLECIASGARVVHRGDVEARMHLQRLDHPPAHHAEA